MASFLHSEPAREQINAALAVVEAAFERLGWNMTPVHILREALADAEKHTSRVRGSS